MLIVLFLLLILLAPKASAQDKPVRIGEVEFFGYDGSDPDKIRAALPFRVGDEITREQSAASTEQARQAVKAVTGREPTDVATICCDDRGNPAIFIGLAGREVRYLQPPKGGARLPSSVVSLYEKFMKVLDEAVGKGAATEDSSKGYALSQYPPLRAIQLEMRSYALHHEGLLRDVLKNGDEQQRIVASEVLGYARRSTAQIIALARASRDSSAEVRNNATRALMLLAGADTDIAKRIPPDSFIEMLLSGTWTDLNKASALLSALTKGRNPKLLARLRQPEVLERLIEMARWRTGHARPARTILGRIAGIEENRLQQLVATGQLDVIIAGLHGSR